MGNRLDIERRVQVTGARFSAASARTALVPAAYCFASRPFVCDMLIREWHEPAFDPSLAAGVKGCSKPCRIDLSWDALAAD